LCRQSPCGLIDRCHAERNFAEYADLTLVKGTWKLLAWWGS
jgi:hypothetical protein